MLSHVPYRSQHTTKQPHKVQYTFTLTTDHGVLDTVIENMLCHCRNLINEVKQQLQNNSRENLTGDTVSENSGDRM